MAGPYNTRQLVDRFFLIHFINRPPFLKTIHRNDRAFAFYILNSEVNESLVKCTKNYSLPIVIGIEIREYYRADCVDFSAKFIVEKNTDETPTPFWTVNNKTKLRRRTE